MESKDYIYKTLPDGLTLDATVWYTSSTGPPTPRPIVLAVHGGGFSAGSKSMIPASQLTYLTRHHLVVAAINYRLCPQVSLHDGPLADVRDAYAWCIAALPALLLRDAGVHADLARVAAMGHSGGGSMALILDATSPPPRALLAFYPGSTYDLPFWHTPIPALASLPPFDAAFTRQVYAGPQAVSSSLTTADDPSTPDFTQPRNAWLFAATAAGTWLRDVVQDGDYARVDPLAYVRASRPGAWPRTCVVHGGEDGFAPLGASRGLVEAMVERGGEGRARLVVVPGADHVFDAALGEGDELFREYVVEGLRFLVDALGESTA